ncbi:MAG: hypothetical protein HZB52_06050 [Chloroflexi bacterium]|nr:hypothetical protein [Chloroflexota bacterium]
MKPQTGFLLAPNGLPTDSAWLFPEHDFNLMQPEKFAPVIIERVLDRGSIIHTRWLLKYYGQKTITHWLRQRGHRRLSHKTFEYWRWVFGIKRYRKQPWETV